MQRVRETVAPAKVNLYLAVGGRRPDGYHDVETVLQSLSFGDRVTCMPSDALEFECAPELGICSDQNLAYRAALSLAEATGNSPDFRIEVHKRIPAGAGLGGGSADAAAVLRLLCSEWDLDPLGADVQDIAASLGADVPYFLSGGTSLFGGRGDVLVRALPPLVADVVLVWPREPVLTAAAYAAFDRMLMPAPPGTDALEHSLAETDAAGVAKALYNGMTEASTGLVPAVGEALTWLTRAEGVHGAAMAGSGSAVFGICRDATSAWLACDAARARGWWAEATTTSLGTGVVTEGECPTEGLVT